MRSILVLAYALALVGVMVPLCGCSCGEAPVQAAAYASPAQACAPAMAAGPCAVPQAQYVAAPAPMFVAAAPVGIQYRVGAAEYGRAALSIPGNLVACGSQLIADAGQAVARALVCVGNNLIPTPTPTARFVYATPPRAAVCTSAACSPMPAVAAPCAPAAVSAPCR